MDIPLKVYGVIPDDKADAHVLLLRDERGTDVLPIWIGAAEGNSIRLAMEGVSPARPLTHDLLKSLVDHFRVTVEKVVVSAVRDITYYASVHLSHNGHSFVIDARPSDAIALAIRSNASIYVAEEVIKGRAMEGLDTWLERLNPENKHEA